MIQLKKIAATAALALALTSAKADHIWFNEFHYDNAGTDTGEFIEIAVRSGSAFDPSNITLSLYNGNGGGTYGTSVTLANAGFTVSSPFSIANSSETITLYSIFASSLGGSIQNGNPDGFALTDNTTMAVIQFISYGGSFTATNGPASGATSVDIGITQSGAPVGSSLGLVGTGDRYSQFSWAVNDDDSPGAVNMGQTFDAVPEPSTYMLLGVGLLFCAQRFRRARKA